MKILTCEMIIDYDIKKHQLIMCKKDGVYRRDYQSFLCDECFKDCIVKGVRKMGLTVGGCDAK